MTLSSFFRTELNGERVALSYDEVHLARRLILDFYEDNLCEPTNLFVTGDAFQFEFWKYCSISFDQEYAESHRTVWLIERGCLAAVNGMALDLLGSQLWPSMKTWDLAKSIANESIPYLDAHEPTDASLQTGKNMLLETLRFMAGMTEEDFDEEGYAKRDLRKQGEWFTQNVVADYYRSTVKSWFPF